MRREPGDVLPTDGPVANDEPAKEYRDPSKVPRGVLDFSSGSEEDEEERGLKRKVLNPGAEDGNRGGNSATGPGRMSLLQYGFSKLLERVKGKPELGEGDSSSGVEEGPSEEYAEDQKRDGTSSAICKSSFTGNGVVCPHKLGMKIWDASSSDRKDGENRSGGRGGNVSLVKQSDEAIREGQYLKGWTNKKITVDEESDENPSPDKKNPNKLKMTVPKAHHFEDYSDESEDLDIEALTGPERVALNSHVRRGDRERGKLDRERKKQSVSVRDKARSKYTENIEIFTSSEDEHTPVKKGRSTGCHLTSPLTERSTVELPSPASKGKDGTIDIVLGNVQEVVYTHSNQRVVGGSKAEELISRAAVRDVFERKMYSQLPANHLLGTQESLSLSQPDSEPWPSAVTREKPRVDHPVNFTSTSVHHTRHTTFIIGETPQAIQRQQLEEMAEKFKFPTVHQFAVEILRRNSTQRLAWLRQYYTSLNHPDLANTVTNSFPQADSVQISTSSSTAASSTCATKSHTDTRTPEKDVLKAKKKRKCTRKNPEPKTKPEVPQNNNVSLPQKKSRIPQNHVPEPETKPTKPQNDVLEPEKPLRDVPSLESEEQEETVWGARGHKRTKRGSVSSSGAFRAGGGLGLDQAGSSGLGSGEAAAFLSRTDRDTPSSRALSHSRSTILSKPTAQGWEQEQNLSCRTSETSQGLGGKPQTPSPPEPATSTSNHSSFLTDLIGDTSILDDLLKPKSRGGQQRIAPKTPPALSSVSISTYLTTPCPSGITLSTDSGSAGRIDFLSSPKSSTAPTHEAVSKGSRKDFWDLLNEGNEESINRLTDPAEVQRVCINTNLAARSRSAEEKSKSLWKTNEKFLWKK